jgi:glutathione S-transferase
MYTLYIANKLYSSWSLRPWVLMQVLSIPFVEKIVPLAEGSSWDVYRAFSPNGRVPCLQDDGLVIWDSLAIAEYLAERHPGVWPEDPIARTFARCAAAEMHSGFGALRQECSMHCGLRVRLSHISPALQHDINRMDELWQEGLSRFGGPFLCGNQFTAVDAFFAPVAFRVQTFNLPLSEPALVYVNQLLALDSMQRWTAAALKEPWTEAAHEQDVLNAGTILADLRSNQQSV